MKEWWEATEPVKKVKIVGRKGEREKNCQKESH
jgi:hypothetical protein